MAIGSVGVIGCSGFVGSHVAAELLAQGFNVHGTLRDPGGRDTGWLTKGVGGGASHGAALTLHDADAENEAALRKALAGCSGVIVCVGTEKQEQATIDFMVGMAERITDIAADLEMEAAVFTSSTGSTNPPGDEPALKVEAEHWSDPDVQIAAGKFSPAAKTLMDRAVLRKMEESGAKLRTATINPSLIAGPCFQPEPVNSLKMFAAILNGKRFEGGALNSSMSIIDARDLARLHVAALTRPDAHGRYFGVKESWHWQDILAALARVVPEYTMPAADPDVERVRPTQFDLSRQNSLGVAVRGLDEILEGVMGELRRRGMI
jgi:dihydroflavonol-4-reductase